MCFGGNLIRGRSVQLVVLACVWLELFYYPVFKFSAFYYVPRYSVYL